MNPKYYSAELLNDAERTAPKTDPEVSQGYKKYFRKLFVDPDIAYMIREELSNRTLPNRARVPYSTCQTRHLP